MDFRPSIPREEFDAVREYVNEFNALGPAATYAHVRKAGQRVRRKRFQVLRKWLHIIRNQYKWFLSSDLGYLGLDYSPERHLRKTIPSEGRRVAAAIQKVQAAREVLCTLDEHFKVLDAIDKFLCLSRQQRAANNTKEQFANSPDLKNELLNAIMSALDAHNAMSTQALNSLTVQSGMTDILLNHARLWETLRERVTG